MDKIWDRKSFEVGGHWQLWRGFQTNDHVEPTKKSNAKKNWKQCKPKPYKTAIQSRIMITYCIDMCIVVIYTKVMISLARSLAKSSVMKQDSPFNATPASY